MAEALGKNQLKLLILTPSKKLVEDIADDVYFPTIEGIVGILPGHTSLVCQLGTGIVHYRKGNMTAFLSISGGVGEVTNDVVTLLADQSEEAASIDLKRAEKALDRSRQRLAGAAKQQEQIDMERAAASEARAIARIEAAALHSSRK